MIFFSYARADAEQFALKLSNDLKDVGAKVWIDQTDIMGGENFHKAIGRALEASTGVLFIVSEKSINSEYVLTEVDYALDESKLVIPILIYQAKLPFRLSGLQYINFIQSYEKGLNELIKALKLAGQVDSISVKSSSVASETPAIKEEEREQKLNTENLDQEELTWQKVYANPSKVAYQSYLNAYPQGRHKQIAGIEIRKLESKEEIEHEKISWWKNSKKRFIVIGLAALLIISFLWFLYKPKENPQTITTPSYENSGAEAYSASVYGEEIIKDKAILHYTKNIILSDAVRVVNLMSFDGFHNLVLIHHECQLDRNNDTILFKYNLFNKDEVTPAVISSMQEFGELLSDSLFNDRPLKVMAYNIKDKIEYLSYTFGIKSPKKKDSAKRINSLKQKPSQNY